MPAGAGAARLAADIGALNRQRQIRRFYQAFRRKYLTFGKFRLPAKQKHTRARSQRVLC
jgi:hypothetical protein